MASLTDAVTPRLDAARRRLERLPLAPRLNEVGRVRTVADGVAMVDGLASTRLDELLTFENGARGLAISLEREGIGVMLLDPEEGITAGGRVAGTGRVIEVPVGPALLGRVVDPLGRPRDGGPAVDAAAHLPIERPAPAIVDRAEVTEPLMTGVLAVDSMIPLGRGQRELIIGDRSIGKTSLAVDAILNQRRSDVTCIYVAIGQKLSTVNRVIESVRADGPFERTIFVIAEADDPSGLQWIAPYAACSMAEQVRDAGGHALLVIDDLSKHAAVHRCCCATRRAARPIPATSSTCTPGCWSAPPSWRRRWAAAR
jgi:F-type H+-transporting ATPase subunit alpha